MGRRRRSDIDDLLESWARWCHSGGVSLGSGSSMLAKMIDNKGLMNFGSGGGKSPLVDCIEARVESIVMAMAKQNQLRADVLRLEVGAGWSSVAKRVDMRGYDPVSSGQFEKAEALGVSVRTYRRRLAAAREQLERELSDVD